MSYADFPAMRFLHRDDRRCLILTAVTAFSVIAHTYRYVNPAFNSDSLGIFRGGVDIIKQVGRGRWLQPMYHLIRGNMCPPFLIGMLATVYLSLSIMLMVEILEIKSRRSIIILCGLLTVCPALVITNAAFIPWTDIFMLSLLFSMISAYSLTVSTGKYRYISAIVFLILSLALYQAYIDACMLVCLFWIMKRSLTDEKENYIRPAAGMAAAFVMSLLVYFVSCRVMCALFSIDQSGSYNSVTSATILSGKFNLPILIARVYYRVLAHTVRPETFRSFAAGGINIVLLLIALDLLFTVVRKKGTAKTAVILSLLLLCPIAANFICLLYTTDDTLLTFPFSMLYLGLLMLFDLVPPERIKQRLSNAGCLLMGIMIFFGVVYSNQVYLKKSIEEQQTLSLMTRVLYHMEQTEGYAAGETKVAFVGSLENSDVCYDKLGYEHLSGRTLDYEISVMYYNNYRMYLNNILGYPINLIETDEAEKISRQPEVAAMPAFPYAGCTAMLGDTLVVKLSDYGE